MMILSRLALLLLPLAALSLHAEEPKPAPAAHVEINSAAREKIDLSLHNDSKKDLSFCKPWPSGVCCSIIARTSDGVLHACRYQETAAEKKEWEGTMMQGPSFLTVNAGENQSSTLPLDVGNWPDIFADWPRMSRLAFCYFNQYGHQLDRLFNSKGLFPSAATSASCKLFPLTPEPGATTPEESKVRIEIEAISKKEIALLIRNDSDREATVFRTANSWGDDSFFLVAEMKDGSFQRFDCELGDYTKNAPDTWTIPAHQTGKETLRLFGRNWGPVLAAWDQIHTFSACYGDRQFRDDRALEPYDGKDFYQGAIVTWPHSIGGMPKAPTEDNAAPAKK